MPPHITFLPLVAFFFLSNGLTISSASTPENDAQRPALHAGATLQVSPSAMENQCYRKDKAGKWLAMYDAASKRIDNRPQETPLFVGMRQDNRPHPSFPAEEGKEYWFNIFTDLPHHIRVKIMEFLQKDLQGQFSLMAISHGFRRLALHMPGRYNDAISTGNNLKKQLFLTLIVGQTGDVALFTQDQQEILDRLTLPELHQVYASKYYNGALVPNTPHGEKYRDSKLWPTNTSYGYQVLDLKDRALRLVPLNFQKAELIVKLDLSHNRLRVIPSLTKLTALILLHLSHNQLQAAPALRHQTNLRLLDLSNNQLSVPPKLSKLKRLECLNLSHNQLQAAPVLRHQTNLTSLDLSHNQLHTPPKLHHQTNLTSLFLSHNQLQAPPDLGHNDRIEDLYLDASVGNDRGLLSRLVRNNITRLGEHKIRFYVCTKNAAGEDEMEKILLWGW